MRRFSWILAGTCLVTLLAVAGTPALAEHEKGAGALDIFGGVYFPDTKVDGDEQFGLRGGYNFTKRFTLEGSVGMFETTEENIGDFETIYFDASFMYALNPEAQGVAYVYGGPGYAETDFDTMGTTVTDDTMTYHVGFGFKAHTEKLYVRPDVRFREFDDCEDECTDWEITLGVGIKF